MNRNDIIHLWLKSLKHGIELPSASAALIDDELDLCLEGPERLEPQIEENGLIRARNALSALVDEDESVDETLVGWVQHIDLKVELVIISHDV